MRRALFSLSGCATLVVGLAIYVSPATAAPRSTAKSPQIGGGE
jgi:hypothetical protein